ncbi:twin-arginine translocase subunit TatE [Candidatus Pantoea persica]|uniref:twin-arginine translocase subunit TatE n=1 Tax=Candidatus Pantoea persica TaxID=2518128 RepID=UPI00215D78D2|nr:twin-arginine translocase subunit TatE [Candidatus Pantoea persica]MBA2815269.1 Sec-independent protein translocase protein TatA [Candidatus Pantoea persica]
MEGISIVKLPIIGALIILLLGTNNKLRSLGCDQGSAIKGFKKAMKDEKPTATQTTAEEFPAERVTHKE